MVIRSQNLAESEILELQDFVGAQVDKEQVAKAFSRAAPGYNETAQFQKSVSQRLVQLTQDIELGSRALHSKPVPQNALRILDLGSGSGASLQELASFFKEPELIALDIAEGMLRQIPRHMGAKKLAADFDHLPLRSESLDLVFSSLSMQWSNSPQKLLAEVWGALKPGGVLAFSTLVKTSLTELHTAWQQVDGELHGLNYPDAEYWSGLLTEFLSPLIFESRREKQHFASAKEALASVKKIGANDHRLTRNQRFIGKQTYKDFFRSLSEQTWQQDMQMYALSYQVLYVIVQKDRAR